MYIKCCRHQCLCVHSRTVLYTCLRPVKISPSGWEIICRVATVEVAEPLLEDLGNLTVSPPAPSQFGQLSYSQQYDHLFAQMPLDPKKPVPKPSPDAQRVRIARLRLPGRPMLTSTMRG